MIKIKLHSITDLITNSSTTIFTYSAGCIEPLKEMINEIAKTLGSDKTCDEMFDAVILCEDSDTYQSYVDNLIENDEDYPEGVDESTDIDKLFEDVKSKKVEKPKWFEDVEEDESRCDYYTPDTFLYLIPKDEKYRKMGELIESFLYSPSHEATRDG